MRGRLAGSGLGKIPVGRRLPSSTQRWWEHPCGAGETRDLDANGRLDTAEPAHPEAVAKGLCRCPPGSWRRHHGCRAPSHIAGANIGTSIIHNGCQ